MCAYNVYDRILSSQPGVQELDALPAESDDGTGIEATLQHGGVRLALEMESCGIDGYSWLHKASKTCAMVMYVVSSEEGFILKCFDCMPHKTAARIHKTAAAGIIVKENEMGGRFVLMESRTRVCEYGYRRLGDLRKFCMQSIGKKGTDLPPTPIHGIGTSDENSRGADDLGTTQGR